MSVSQLDNAAQQLLQPVHAVFLNVLLAFDAKAVRERIKGIKDIRWAREVLATEAQ